MKDGLDLEDAYRGAGMQRLLLVLLSLLSSGLVLLTLFILLMWPLVSTGVWLGLAADLVGIGVSVYYLRGGSILSPPSLAVGTLGVTVHRGAISGTIPWTSFEPEVRPAARGGVRFPFRRKPGESPIEWLVVSRSDARLILADPHWSHRSLPEATLRRIGLPAGWPREAVDTEVRNG